MFYLIHGPNTKASYDRLSELESEFPKEKQIKLGKEHSYDDLYQAVFSTSLIDDKQLVVVQNFLKDKKIDLKKSVFDKDIPDKTIIFYEQSQLTPATVTKLPKHFNVETFKNEAFIYYFLDSISPSLMLSLKNMQSLQSSEEPLLIWQLANRFLLMTVARAGLSQKAASGLSGRQVAPWQWQKIRSQAMRFDLPTLKSIYSGLLKIDYMIKTGKTALPGKTLISYLFLKYLHG
jgi:DNA polymerase III delta subunit